MRPLFAIDNDPFSPLKRAEHQKWLWDESVLPGDLQELLLLFPTKPFSIEPPTLFSFASQIGAEKGQENLLVFDSKEELERILEPYFQQEDFSDSLVQEKTQGMTTYWVVYRGMMKGIAHGCNVCGKITTGPPKMRFSRKGTDFYCNSPSHHIDADKKTGVGSYASIASINDGDPFDQCLEPW
jgi:hypothetical protein